MGLRTRDDVHVVLGHVRHVCRQDVGSEKIDVVQVLNRRLVSVPLGDGAGFRKMLRKVQMHGDAPLMRFLLGLAQDLLRHGIRRMRREVHAEPIVEAAVVVVMQLEPGRQAGRDIAGVVDDDLAVLNVADRTDVSRVGQPETGAKPSRSTRLIQMSAPPKFSSTIVVAPPSNIAIASHSMMAANSSWLSSV